MSASPAWIAAAATLTDAAAVAPETLSVFEKVGRMPRYSLTATLMRAKGATKLGAVTSPSTCALSMPASSSASRVASALNQRALRPGTLPTGVSPTPTIATWPL